MALSRKLTAKIYEIKAHNGNVTGVDLGETGRVLVTGGQDRNVNLWAIGEEKCFMSLTGHNRPIDCVRFAYNDDFVYSADDIGIIRRWDLNAQTIYSTLNGHMKSVRTLDFNPSGEYVVSGSNDTTVRLWDVRNQNKCIKIYRGHMTHVNSVKFSPDGLWIASAGTEGSVIIWDIRKSKQIMEFTEQPPAVAITCIQFHPFEFLLAAGRIDGTVCIYDLESRLCISKTNATSQFYGHPIRCITFSENGECLFVGTSLGISVIGWEPDREFDNIKPVWNSLGDMKIVNRKLICCSYDKDYVTINALSINRVFPFYNPSNVSTPAFSHNSTTRKSFSRGNQKLRLSIVHVPKPSRLIEENEENQSPSLDGQSSPNLSLEIVDDTPNDFNGSPTLNGGCATNGSVNSNVHFDTNNEITLNMPKKTTSSPPFHYSSIASSSGYSSFGGNGFTASNFEGPSSLKMPGERDIYQYENVAGVVCNDVEYNPNDSNPPIIANYDQTEMIEDFPVNQNSHQPHTSATSAIAAASVTSSTSGHVAARSTKSKVSNVQKRFATGSNTHMRGKLSQVSSVSTTELNKIDDNMLLKKSASSYIVNKGGKRPVNSQMQSNKENARNKNISVQFITKPPMRSKTSLDLRTSHQHQQMAATAAAQRQANRVSSYTAEATSTTNIPISYRPDANLITQSRFTNKNLNNRGISIDDSSELQMLSASHVHILQELSNRNATLHLIRNLTRSHDIVGALRQSIKMSERSIFVDLLGAILEKTSLWNLDLCLLILPEIYELLQSQQKFHYIRACDTLRVILSNFLPIIQENLDPWAACGLGVDVSREERQRKCIECQHWLLKIRNLPASNHLGTSLTQLQNMIVNI